MAKNINERLNEIFEDEDELREAVMHDENDSSFNHNFDVHLLGDEYPDVVHMLNRRED